MDTCEPEGSGPSGGDLCSEGKWSADDCKTGDGDSCFDLTDDICPDGTNTQSGHHFTDYCDGISGSDQCPDGSEGEDLCNSFDIDACPGGSAYRDKCDPAISSDDYCLGGLDDNDECGVPADADQCPGGGPNEDACPTGEAPEDECTSAGGCAGGDQTGPEPPIDNCSPPDDACTMASPDNAE